ncbi:MAG: hypothetical protein M0P40_08700 [Bacteroidales bacterium]|jgi:hypothetical protein|nr:hypothetical protein [Bacteroidales bacterium]MDD2265034.1 hypothetical protein [Bacteroidales bacterium]MDD2832220.1 hypothetical protein [Bacteroidales bacterium]MDD4474022.1 hypothetical protein [Bacteroidales bacterium]MDD5046999.1 hypothetical protein [Bacteroidales bacterium]
MLYIVKYSGPFGFIKPWTAVRDSETYSQQFLTPSIIAGIERKLFPKTLSSDFNICKIKRHRLTYQQIAQQQEQTQPRGWNAKGTVQNRSYERPYAILIRGVMVNPVLYLAFENREDAEHAATQHICLARNEDILYPDQEVLEVTEKEFENNDELFYGFELMLEKNEKSFMVGYNRMNNNQPMYGWLKIVGNPVKNEFK